MITCNPKTGQVHIGGILLDPKPSQEEIYNHSPDGFNWGYWGSGPMQLAMAICLHYTNDQGWTKKHYQNMVYDIIVNWPKDKMVRVPEKNIKDWIKKRGGAII